MRCGKFIVQPGGEPTRRVVQPGGSNGGGASPKAGKGSGSGQNRAGQSSGNWGDNGSGHGNGNGGGQSVEALVDLDTTRALRLSLLAIYPAESELIKDLDGKIAKAEAFQQKAAQANPLSQAVGREPGNKVRNDRFAKVFKKCRRLKLLTNSFAHSHKVVKTGVSPAFLYATSIYGVSEHNLSRYRTLVHTTIVNKAQARSCTADLLLAGKDIEPAYNAVGSPIVMFLASLWDSVLPKPFLFRTLSSVLHKAAQGSFAITGPVSAMCRSLSSLGWHFKSAANPGCLVSSTGREIDILTSAPKSVALLIRQDVERVRWEKAPQYSSIQPYPWIEPIVSLLNAKNKTDWGPVEKGMLRSVCAHGIWPAARLKEAGYQTDGLCLCGEPDTLGHRLYSCPITHGYRIQYNLAAELSQARLEQPHLSMWTDCLAPLPFDGLPSALENPALFGTPPLTPFSRG